ncbi:hypothetical protein ATO49_06095 [Mycolicibacterium fortuitum subsp. fortuitum DSM 46621 = ATCC 6841 = JCM 6387]|nr:hypothetical protein ATO49_06095 [Mycolicibacterium fortuitum subsp. fortuitum DSM 46621 = ATCC 6841 = JCM 6387]
MLGSRVTDTRLPRFLLAGPAGGSERREQKFVDEPGERVVEKAGSGAVKNSMMKPWNAASAMRERVSAT